MPSQYLSGIDQGLFNPGAQKAGPHGGPRPVNGPQEAALPLAVPDSLRQFQIGTAGSIQQHIVTQHIGLDVRWRQILFLGFFQISQKGRGSQRPHALGLGKVQIPFPGPFQCKGLIREDRVDHWISFHHCLETLIVEKALIDHVLYRFQAGKLVKELILGAARQELSRLKAAGGQITGSQAEGPALLADGAQVAVGIGIDGLRVGQCTGCQDTDYLAFHKAFGLSRVLHLIANGHLVATGQKFPQIRICRVVGNTAHGRPLLHTAFTPGQGQLQLSRSDQGIIKEEFIEIAQTEKNQAVGIFFLFLDQLQHHGCQLLFINSIKGQVFHLRSILLINLL